MTKAEAAKILRSYVAHTAPHVDPLMVKASRRAIARLLRKAR